MERQAIAKAQKTPASVNHLRTQPARSSSAGHPLLELQRSIGNQAVQRLISSPYIQTKLQVSTPTDPLEQEAERNAETVMRSSYGAVTDSQGLSLRQRPNASEHGAGARDTVPRVSRSSLVHHPRSDEELEESGSPLVEIEQNGQLEQSRSPLLRHTDWTMAPVPAIQRKCGCGGNAGSSSQCTDCEAKKPPLQRQASGAQGQTALPSSVTHVLQTHNGGPLPKTTRNEMESALGADLSAVRIHTDSQAARAAVDINAEAFTQGQDIYFGAGRYEPETREGKRLLTHELVHTIQQRSGRVAASREGYSVSQPEDAQEKEAEAIARRVVAGEEGAPISLSHIEAGHIHRDILDDVIEGAGAVAETVVEGAQSAKETVVEGAGAVVETVVEGAEAAAEAGAEALDWLATEAGRWATQLADALGASVRITTAGLEISVPETCPLDAVRLLIKLPSLKEDLMAPVFAIPIGPDLFLSGELGVAAGIAPKLQIQMGPFCLTGLHILINPLTNDYSIEGGLSATAALALEAELRAGLRGQLGLKALIPIPVPPYLLPITVPLVGVEGGLAGMVRGIAAGTLMIGGGLSISGGTVSMSHSHQLDMGVGADLFAGAYAQLDILGQNVCRIYWQPYEWHGGVAISLGTDIDLTVSPGGSPGISVGITPHLEQLPFDQIPLVINREGFRDDCPIKDDLCAVLRLLKLLPSQNGGEWKWSGPYGPGNPLDGPLQVYETDPDIASRSTCRGACGPDCKTCEHHPVYHYIDPATLKVWEYTNFEDCDSHEGCRQHDAGFDWAAAEKGETGGGAIVMPWHMAANVECTCVNLGGNCLAWIAGLPPFDMKMYFADTAVELAGTVASDACLEVHPDAIDCTPDNSDRDTVLEAWGSANRIGDFRDCRIFRGMTSPGLEACDGASGNIWRCTATDLPTGQDFTVSIHECECCGEDGTFGSEWRQPEVVVTGDMSDELILSLCERDLIARVICIPIEEEMIDRFGKRRDLDLDPDLDPKSPERLDDAPIFETFRKFYNRLDSWNAFLQARHPDLHPEFQSKFELAVKRDEWFNTLKDETTKYKRQFRGLENQDVKAIQRAFQDKVLGKIQPEMESLNLEIAKWFKDKTGSGEPIDTLIERVHVEGTKIWREAWRSAILQVNRVLARLWPPAKTRILLFIGQKQAQHPDVDLSGKVEELDYIGSLATGFKGPPKQQVRFNPEKFDVDANLEAPPLAKYAVAIDKAVPDRKRIFASDTTIDPLNEFSHAAHEELKVRARHDSKGYDPTDPFDVVINAPEFPTQERQRVATERIYGLRDKLDKTKYSELIEELKREKLVVFSQQEGRFEVRSDLTPEQFKQLSEILDRFEQGT